MKNSKQILFAIILLLFLDTNLSFSQNSFPATGHTILDGKLSFKSGLSDGRLRGIWFWRETDPNHAIYSSASTGISPAGNDAADGLWNSGHRLRFRTAKTQGFLFENMEEIALLDIDAQNGNIRSIGIAQFLGSSNNFFSGNVGIGNTNPTEKLVVDGKIIAEEVKVQTVPASDYVFEPDYNLLSLLEVESFIQENKHLPDIPSAEEFKVNGVGLGEMDNMLLRKVEELTLYVIQQQKEIYALKKENQSLMEENEIIRTDLLKEIETIKTQLK